MRNFLLFVLFGGAAFAQTNYYYGTGCAGTTSYASCAVGGTNQYSGNYLVAATFTTGSNASGYSVATCGVYIGILDSATPQYTCSIYTGTDTSNSTKICQGAEASAAVTGWNEGGSFSGCTLSPNTAYLVAVQLKSSTQAVVHDSTQQPSYIANTYGSYPATVPWSTGSTYSLYVKVTPAGSGGGGQVATPTFNPVQGTYTSSQTVTISTTTSGASIRYTTDNTTPTESYGTQYSGPITVSSTTTIKAIAYETGWTDSSVASAQYTVSGGSGSSQWTSSGSNIYFSSGHVGIGTTNPQYLLSVNGTIGAKDVTVINTGWSDYVFHPDYRLEPLSEVNAYIQANHHLPDIPSEAEVKEKGVSVSEMQTKLLAKIEELTLHMIQQDKENRALREQMAQRAKQNQELCNRIAQLERHETRVHSGPAAPAKYPVR